MNVVIIGAGGHGRVVLDILRLADLHTPVGFIDADTDRAGSTVANLPILGPINQLAKLRRQNITAAIVAIGDNRVRLSYAQFVLEAGLELINAIHPAAIISPTVQLGRNLTIAAGAVISTDAAIADHTIINTSAVVDHECRIGPAVHICPGALLAGRVEIDEGAFVGLGAIILPCLKIGHHATIGAGAVVRHDIPPNATAVGVPARLINAPPNA
jgi:UDP-perosamine 4-acetyltransferase